MRTVVSIAVCWHVDSIVAAFPRGNEVVCYTVLPAARSARDFSSALSRRASPVLGSRGRYLRRSGRVLADPQGTLRTSLTAEVSPGPGEALAGRTPA